MSLSKIKDLLGKYAHITPQDKIVKEACVETIKEIFYKTISTKNISVNRNNIYIKAHPTLKHEIQLRKQDVIDSLNKKLSQEKSFIKDVR